MPITTAPQRDDYSRLLKIGNEKPQPEKWRGKPQKSDWFGVWFRCRPEALNPLSPDFKGIVSVFQGHVNVLEEEAIKIEQAQLILKPSWCADPLEYFGSAGLKLELSGRAFVISRLAWAGRRCGMPRLYRCRDAPRACLGDMRPIYKKGRVKWVKR